MIKEVYLIKEFPRHVKLYCDGVVINSMKITAGNKREVFTKMKGVYFDVTYYKRQMYLQGYYAPVTLELKMKQRKLCP